MASPPRSTLWARLTSLWRAPPLQPPELARAQALIAAVDNGGVPLFPGKVNEIARSLGLEVSGKAPVEDTIARIRQALARQGR